MGQAIDNKGEGVPPHWNVVAWCWVSGYDGTASDENLLAQTILCAVPGQLTTLCRCPGFETVCCVTYLEVDIALSQEDSQRNRSHASRSRKANETKVPQHGTLGEKDKSRHFAEHEPKLEG